MTRRTHITLLTAAALGAIVPAVAKENRMFQQILEASQNEKKGITLYIKGHQIGGVASFVKASAISSRAAVPEALSSAPLRTTRTGPTRARPPRTIMPPCSHHLCRLNLCSLLGSKGAASSRAASRTDPGRRVRARRHAGPKCEDPRLHLKQRGHRHRRPADNDRRC